MEACVRTQSENNNLKLTQYLPTPKRWKENDNDMATPLIYEQIWSGIVRPTGGILWTSPVPYDKCDGTESQ